MNDFSIHVGSINALYKGIFCNVSGFDIDGTLQYRPTLIDAVVSISDAFDLWTPMKQFISEHPEVIYVPETSTPIQLENEALPLNAWLVRHDSFTTNEHNRCYHWNLERVLSIEDPYYSMYLYLLLNRSNAYNVEIILSNEHSMAAEEEVFGRVVDKILTKGYPGLEPLQPSTATAIERWMDSLVKTRRPTTAAKGRRPNQSGSVKQKAVCILIKLLQETKVFKRNDKEMTKAFSALTGYGTDGLQRALSALQTGNDKQFQFNKDDFDETQQLLENMLTSLSEIRNKMTI